MTTPLTDQQLADADARANAATPGPWGVYESGFLIEVAADLEETGHGYRARRGICRLEDEPLDNDPAHRGWMAEEDWEQVQADAAFIAAMSPETAKKLTAEIRRLRTELASANARLDATARLAGRQENKLRELGAPATVDAMTVTSEFETGVCTFGEGDAPGSGCILPAGHKPTNRHVVTPVDAEYDD